VTPDSNPGAERLLAEAAELSRAANDLTDTFVAAPTVLAQVDRVLRRNPGSSRTLVW
jgi:hypothetical protein